MNTSIYIGRLRYLKMINSDKPDNPLSPQEIYVEHIADRFKAMRRELDALEEAFRFVLSNYLNK